MLLASVPPKEASKPPAPKGRKDSEAEKKKRADILSWPPRNSRSQLVVNWSSVYFPVLLTTNGAEFNVTWQVTGFTLTPGAPGKEGIRYPPVVFPNWLLLNCSSFRTTGSMPGSGIAGHDPAAGVLKSAIISFTKLGEVRSDGRIGNPGLSICVPGDRALRCLVP